VSRLDLLPPGFEVGRYQILDLLGQGGMAAVYRVRHRKLGSLHALKVVTVPSRSILRRLTLEGQAQARVRHRHIVAVHDVLEVDGSPGLLMEFVDGPTLEELLDHPLPLPVADHLARGLLKGVAAAHAAGLVHRDLKPANVLVAMEEDGLVPKVADFGLVKDAHAGESRTRSGTLMGTPNYMSPEQIRDAKTVDHRADVFALGAILYELVTGLRAFDGDDVLFIFNKVAMGDYRPVAELRPDVPERMVRAIDAALQIERDDRADSVADLLTAWCGEVDDLALQGMLGPVPEGLQAVIETSRRPAPDVRSPPVSAGHPTLTAPTDSGEPKVADTFVTPPDDTPPTSAEAAPLPPPAPRRRLGWALLAVGLLLGTALLGLGAGGLGWTVTRPTADPVAEQVEEPRTGPPPPPVPELAAPAPAAAAPEATDVAPPAPDRPAPPPVPAAPQATSEPEPPSPPEPAPEPEPEPAPVPAPDAAPVPAPVPAAAPPQPAPAAGSTAHVQVEGDVEVLLVPLDGGDAVQPSAVVPAGHYAVTASMADGEPPVRALTLELAPGDAVVLECVRALRRCTRKP